MKCAFIKKCGENNERGKQKCEKKQTERTKKMENDHIIIREFVIELRLSKYGRKCLTDSKSTNVICDMSTRFLTLMMKDCSRPKHKVRGR